MKRIVAGMVVAWTMVLPVHAQPARIDESLGAALQGAAANQRVPVILRMTGRIDPRAAGASDPANRSEAIIRALRQQADKNEPPLRAFLQANGAEEVKSLWLINGLSAHLSARAVEQLANHPGVESITLDATLAITPTTLGTPAPAEWNLSQIGADTLWQQGYQGQGVIVASMDTGVDAAHPDIGPRWRGGTNSWFDPSGAHATPIDLQGHGTRTMGIMVGGDAGGTSIGVAPGAQWIAAKIFNDEGVANFSGIHLSYQWMIDPDGNPSVNDAPHVVLNAWGLTNAAGSCVTEFQYDIDALRAAGIALAYSAGNAGPALSTSVSPANYAGNLSVGAVDDVQAIASFSSRGPSACDGTIFPVVAAPGVNVHTADLTFGGLIPDAYTDVVGTSFSAAHVAGGMALLKSAQPQASASSIEKALRDSSRDIGTPGGDNESGYGLIDLVSAHQLLLQPTIPGTLSFSSENYTVAENGGEVRITVMRSGGSDGTVSVEYSTADGTALAGPDYAAASGVMQFAAGETSHTFAVPIVDDTLHEADESLTLTLANPTGGAVLGWPGSAVLTIADNDAAAGDADGDGYTVVNDCNDSDATVHPGAVEIKQDGIDQDCNGYDLTINILKAEFDSRRNKLTVQATSALGSRAALNVVGYGSMKWNKSNSSWTLNVTSSGGDPGVVTVQGVEGSEQSPTLPR